MQLFRSPVLTILLACLMSGPAHAGTCTSPAGNEADRFYNADYHTYQFCNGTTWIAEGAPGGGSGMTLISTQTASSSASLQFTNLPTSYNTLFLNCAGLVNSLSGTNTIVVYVGEGATPTWETGAHYTVAIPYWASDGSSGVISGTTRGDATGNAFGTDSSSVPHAIQLYINNVGSSSLYKVMQMHLSKTYSNGIFYSVFGSSYWNDDTNPITGIEVAITGGGSISSGTCSLYGMN